MKRNSTREGSVPSLLLLTGCLHFGAGPALGTQDCTLREMTLVTPPLCPIQLYALNLFCSSPGKPLWLLNLKNIAADALSFGCALWRTTWSLCSVCCSNSSSSLSRNNANPMASQLLSFTPVCDDWDSRILSGLPPHHRAQTYISFICKKVLNG